MNGKERALARAIRWRSAAIGDGWDSKPIYRLEPEDTATRMTKDGYLAFVYCRPGSTASVSIWDARGISITPPWEYDWSQIVANSALCHICGAKGVETHRYSFAGRCCKPCLPEARRKYEFRGWAD